MRARGLRCVRWLVLLPLFRAGHCRQPRQASGEMADPVGKVVVAAALAFFGGLGFFTRGKA